MKKRGLSALAIILIIVFLFLIIIGSFLIFEKKENENKPQENFSHNFNLDNINESGVYRSFSSQVISPGEEISVILYIHLKN